MLNSSQASRILAKAKPAGQTARLSMDKHETVHFTIEPLFQSIGRTPGPAAASTSIWQLWTPTFPIAESNLWDTCHQLVQGTLEFDDNVGFDGASVIELAEPDVPQRWVIGQDAALAFAATSPCPTQGAQEDGRFPGDPQHLLWFHDHEHAQFDEALAHLGAFQPKDVVRVAHLDTGYDPNHATLPARLNRDLQRNFVDPDPDEANDASDDSGGLLNSLGHGAGTLGILAGRALANGQAIGCAPFVEVVPIRVANGVALFYNSAIARALDYVHSLCANPDTRVHVVTMSMGGLPSQAWADAVNALYEAGVFVVTAAGNNFGNLPVRSIVYPARFRRVVAACGVMADNQPYADLDLLEMAGNYGPPEKMNTALSAYTPNIPWAKLGCSTIIDYNGAGTSAATPQIAAAAAIWIQQHKSAWEHYAQGWMRVEAVRRALFESATNLDQTHLGHGILRALDALNLGAAPENALAAEEPDSVAFPILRLITGLGVADEAAGEVSARQQMLELEALQLAQSSTIEEILFPDSLDATSEKTVLAARLREALAADPRASRTLVEALRVPLGRPSTHAPPATSAPSRASATLPGGDATNNGLVAREHLAHALAPTVPSPLQRSLRVFAYDPSLGTNLETLGINEATLDLRWEDQLQPGPVGEYLEVVDVDSSSGCCYAPIDLNHPHLLAQNGLRPSEGTPQFHQQMAYAVAMTTIQHFERALGRVALWSPRKASASAPGKPADYRYVQRLRIYPHALRAANAYYSSAHKALLLGYFRASTTDSGDVFPGGLVFSALSHDIIAHETTHALLDGLHYRFQEFTNPDVPAFHEAFADLVALFQHFTMTESVRQQIARSRGNLLGRETLLAQLAVQFGKATGRYGALRDAIGDITDDQQWVPKQPTRKDYLQASAEPHDRGSLLVAAVFEAFLQIYQIRSAALMRLVTNGTGVFPPGELPDLVVDRLALEASKVAGQVLNMCIRALDYCPPVDITFGEYLRALITADHDLVPKDEYGYRVALVDAFRKRGIYPDAAKSWSVDTLLWEPPLQTLPHLQGTLETLSLTWDLNTERETAYNTSRANARKMHDWLINLSDHEVAALGLSRKVGPTTLGSIAGELRGLEVHSVRPAQRVGPDGQLQTDLVVEITQTFRPADRNLGLFRGGVTLLIDLESYKARYAIYKRVNDERRYNAQRDFEQLMAAQLSDNYFDHTVDDHASRVEPFAALHRGSPQKERGAKRARLLSRGGSR